MLDKSIQLFTKEECAVIISYTTELSKGAQAKRENRTTSFKSCQLKPNNENDWVFQRIYDFVEASLNINIIHQLDYLMINQYDLTDRFDKHKDFYFKDQIFNVLTQLNEEYDGGDFNLYEPDFTLNKTTGATCIFENTRWHEVKPIISGERVSMIGFFLKGQLSKNKSLI